MNLKKIVIALIFAPLLAHAQWRDTTFWQQSTNLNKTRFNAVAFGGGGMAAASLGGLYFAWYADYPQSSFHFVNDNSNWGGMDKLGHATTTYAVGESSYDVLKWSGVNENKAIWYGGLTGFTYMAVIEVMDGFSEGWGFSTTDFAFNTLGAGLFIAQQKVWKEQRFMLKWSYHSTIYPGYLKDGPSKGLLGSSWTESWLKDYNGQTYWLSANPHSFAPEALHWWPQWLNLAGGYSIDGFVSADGSNLAYPDVKSQGQYYLSFDIDLRKIKVKNDFWRSVLHTISFIKIPAPAVEFNQHGATKLYWLYF